MRHLPVITNSEMKAFRRCQRYWSYRYLLGYSPRKKAGPLRFGSLMHAGLETWWATAGDLDAALTRIRAESENPLDRVKATELMRGYHYRWVNEPITVIAVEQEFRAPIVHPDTGAVMQVAELAGKFDAICEHDGYQYLPEHKTSAENLADGADYWRVLRLDSQISTYIIGARALGYEPRGVLYDVVAKPSIDPHSATPEAKRKYTKAGQLYANQRAQDETLDEYAERLRESIIHNVEDYYKRAVVVRLEHETRDAMRDIWDTAAAIHAAQAAHYHPKNPDSCRAFNRVCSFFEVCTKEASLDDELRFEKLDNPHQELSHAISSKTAA